MDEPLANRFRSSCVVEQNGERGAVVRDADNPPRIKAIWDMETGDPDDFLTLVLLAGHPRVDLKAVTITPVSYTHLTLPTN